MKTHDTQKPKYSRGSFSAWLSFNLLMIPVLGEPFALWHFAGMALVIIGVLVLSQKRPGLSEN